MEITYAYTLKSIESQTVFGIGTTI